MTSTPTVDQQANSYPRSCVEALVGRSAFAKVERHPNGEYVLWVDDGVAQPALAILTKDIDEHLAQAHCASRSTRTVGGSVE